MANNPAPATGTANNPAANIGAPAESSTGGSVSSNAHHLFAAFAGELIGVAVLAVFADMSEDLGKIAVALMAGWFLLFLMINATDISGIVSKV